MAYRDPDKPFLVDFFERAAVGRLLSDAEVTAQAELLERQLRLDALRRVVFHPQRLPYEERRARDTDRQRRRRQKQSMWWLFRQPAATSSASAPERGFLKEEGA